MRFIKSMVVFGVLSTVSCIGFADTTNTIKQQNTKNKINNQIVGKASVNVGWFSGGDATVGGSATQNSIIVKDTKKNHTNTIDLKGGDNTITGQGTQNSITVGTVPK